MTHLTKKLQRIKMGSAHLLLDIWSSQQKMAVIGIQVRFIHDWKIRQYTLGFRHFPGTHDGKRIREVLETMLKETYGLNMYDVSKNCCISVNHGKRYYDILSITNAFVF